VNDEESSNPKGVATETRPCCNHCLWLHSSGLLHQRAFEWQAGYADFSVNQSNLEEIKEYVAGQEDHHRRMSFQEELRALRREHQIEWDERYVWD
jgi:hypothetical protein